MISSLGKICIFIMILHSNYSFAAFKDLDPAAQEKARENYARFVKLQPEEQSELKKNWSQYQSMDENHRRTIERKYLTFRSMNTEQRHYLIRRASQRRRSPPFEPSHRKPVD